ncbi:YciI family protein [Nonomuraea sp. B12E4]|uniref:YciI family protein n=1 Tax=Nonomuraea sp. B12E4 TaxID=3153564 RepID=UPI00325D28F5
MRYLLLICGDDESYQAMLADPGFLPDCEAWAAARGDGLILSGGLEPPADATTVRVRDGETLLTDGPFVESKEIVAGFSIIECATREEAVQAARAHPVARHGTIELRALQP